MALPKVYIIIFAIFVTMTSISMTAVAAWDRGGTLLDKSLLISMSVVIVLAVHLLPAISRRSSAWVVWSVCLVCSIYGHLTFLTHANIRAGEIMAQQSVLNIGIDNQAAIVKAALAQIKARPVTEVMAQLSQTEDKRVRAALREEIAEGKKAETLRDELIRLSQVSTSAKVEGANDPLTAKLSNVFGWNKEAIFVVIGLTFSILVELVGALIWYEALRPSVKESEDREVVSQLLAQSKNKSVTHSVTQNVTGVTTDVTTDITGELTNSVTEVDKSVTLPANQTISDQEINSESEMARLVPNLKMAIQTGKCKGTVAGIRKFLCCSQSRAQEIRRQIA
jgi:hypothetical protein